MQHIESSVRIYHTREYARFNLINGNRQLNESKIKKLKRDIVAGLDMLRYCPVIVVENKNRLDIIDGQHRFFVARSLKLSIWYVIADPLELTDIAKVNNNTEKWKPKDYINCFVQNDNENYKELQEFMDRHRLPLSVCLKLLSGRMVTNTGTGNSEGEAFKSGYFKVEPKARASAEAIAQLCEKFASFDGHKSRPFITALSMIVTAGKCNVDDLIAKFTKDPSRLIKQVNHKEYLVNLETIYNIGAHQRRVIF